MAMFSVSWLAGERRILPTLSTMLNTRFPPRHVTGGTPSYLAVSEDRLMAGEETRWFHLPPEEGVIFLPYCASRCPHLRGAICAVTVLFPRWSSELV